MLRVPLLRTTMLLLTLCVWTASDAWSASIDYKKLYGDVSDSVVLIHGTDGATGSQGTGSIIGRRGLILTNTHVIAQGDQDWPRIYVFLKPDKMTGDLQRDLREGFPARVVAKHPGYDLALLQILQCTRPLEALPLSTLEGVAIGEPTIAIGHPGGGAAWSLTTGTIGASFQDMMGRKGWHVFQTETPLNPGNSGGPLLDGSGAIIGINTFIRRQGRDGLALVGLNFAVKSTTARTWLNSVIARLPGADELVSSTAAATAGRPAPPREVRPHGAQDRSSSAGAAPPSTSPTAGSPGRQVSADGSWLLVPPTSKPPPKRRPLAKAKRRPSSGYSSDVAPGTVFTARAIQAVAKRRREAFDELDSAVDDD